MIVAGIGVVGAVGLVGYFAARLTAADQQPGSVSLVTLVVWLAVLASSAVLLMASLSVYRGLRRARAGDRGATSSTTARRRNY